MNDKPRHQSGYTMAATEVVRSACLTVAVTLGAFLDDVVVIGGLVPSLLIDSQINIVGQTEESHSGTNDLDLGLSLALLNGQRYTELSKRLRSEGFKPDTNDAGNKTIQRWRLSNLTVDFLMPPAPNQNPGRRVQNLETDFGAIITPGLELAFDEQIPIQIEGLTLSGERAAREMPVCGPGAFVVLKALAFGDRAEPKDAYDLLYILRRTPGASQTVAAKLVEHTSSHSKLVSQALATLTRDFESPGHIGPQRAASFQHLLPSEVDETAADAHGLVEDLLQAYRRILSEGSANER